MSRRQRHLNPAHAGATCVLDARFLSGVGGTVTTWTPRFGTGPTQATPANRPTLLAAGIGGAQTVTFGATDSLVWSTSPITGASAVTIFAVSSRASNTGGALLTNFGSPGLADHSPWTDGNYYLGTASTNRKTFVAPTAIGAPVVESVTSLMSSWTWRANGVTSFTTVSSVVGIGATPSLSGAGFDWIGNVGAVATFPFDLSEPMRKRIAHAFAFSFKIPHS